MKSIVLFGTGNVATHLFNALFEAQNHKIIQVYNHQPGSLAIFQNKISTTSKLDDVVEADIYLLALKDEAIPEIALKLKDKGAILLHTSGATSLSALEPFESRGVLYPLQTFSRNKPVNFNHVPICIEANNSQSLEIVETLAEDLSEKVYHLSSHQRKWMHLAAVFVCNFVNHLYTEGEEICKENNLPFEILQPLIAETASKIENLKPFEAQTGPARRADTGVINSHLNLLQGDRKKIYEILTSSIQNLHGKKL